MADAKLSLQDGRLVSQIPIDLSLGANPIKLSWDTDLDELASGSEFQLILKFGANLTGIAFDARVEYRGIFIESSIIPAFGSSETRVYLPKLINAGILNIIITAKKILPVGQLNAPTDGTKQVQLNKIFINTTDKPIGTRELLISYCEQLAANLGLSGNYMKGKRSQEIVKDVKSSLINGCGFSVVRLGDGEGRILAEDGFFSDIELLQQTLNYHFGTVSNKNFQSEYGRDWIRRAIHELKKIIIPAIDHADILGLPVADYFASARKNVVSGHFGYVAALLFGLTRNPRRPQEKIVGTNVFQLMALEPDAIPEMMRSAESVSIIGPWDLRSRLADALPDIKLDDFIETQQHFSFREETSWGQYPIHWEITKAAIANLGNLQGRLFLVAGGLLGKSYCHQVKMQGGVALDIGSVLDSWAKMGRTDAILASERVTIENFKL